MALAGLVDSGTRSFAGLRGSRGSPRLRLAPMHPALTDSIKEIHEGGHPMGTKISNLLIVSHVLHYEYRGRVYAYGPYTREIDIWADLVPEIRIASPLCAEEPPKDCLPFTRANIRLVPQRRTGGDTFAAK